MQDLSFSLQMPAGSAMSVGIKYYPVGAACSATSGSLEATLSLAAAGYTGGSAATTVQLHKTRFAGVNWARVSSIVFYPRTYNTTVVIKAHDRFLWG